VINSILDQIIFAGCRFVTKTEISGHGHTFEKKRKMEQWEIVSKNDARKKIAHAFRDKRHGQDFSHLMSRLETRTGFQKSPEDIPDSHYIAANAMMLTVKLSENDRESYVNAVLCDAIDNVGADTDDCEKNRNFPFNHPSRLILPNEMRLALSKVSMIYVSIIWLD
jgi:GTP-dependent phosphoenolpyruvate carboxykinase